MKHFMLQVVAVSIGTILGLTIFFGAAVLWYFNLIHWN
jgi:hypothetical protein